MVLSTFLSKEKISPYIFLISIFFLGRSLFLLITLFENHEPIDYNGFISDFLIVISSLVVYYSNPSGKSEYKNSFIPYFFLLLVTCYIGYNANINIIVANIFVLFGLRSILIIPDDSQRKYRIFDSTFAFGLATCFFSDCIWFIIIVFFNLILHNKKNSIKDWFIPALALGSIIIMDHALHILFPTYSKRILLSMTFFDLNRTIAFDDLFKYIPFLSLFLVCFLINIYLVSNRVKFQNYKKKIWLLMFSMIISVLIVLFGVPQDNNTLIFCIFPFSYILYNLVSTIFNDTLKESILWLISILCIATGVSFTHLFV